MALVATLLCSCAPLPPAVLAQRQRAALARGDHAEAIRLGRVRVEARPADVGARYDLACALAKGGDDSAALVAWTVAPERFAGVLAMAPPAELFGHSLPERGAPVVILVGEKDPALAAWRQAQPVWQRAGRRVTFIEVADKGHEFLLDEARLRDALERLAR